MFIIILWQKISGVDPAAQIATFFHLGHGAIAIMLFAGMFTFWLMLGNITRVITVYGSLLGGLIGYLVWKFIEPRNWIIREFLVGAFGDSGGVLVFVVEIFIVVVVICVFSIRGKKLIKKIIHNSISWEIKRKNKIHY